MNKFHDINDDLMKEAAAMSDAELERLLTGGPGGARNAASAESLLPGTRVSGVVVDFRGGEILVDLDGKTLGLLAESEFEGVELPRIGERIQAQFEHFDARKDLAILSAHGVRKEVFWDELRRGAVVEGVVTAVNKGGLTLDIKGSRAFLPVSQIARERVEDLSQFVGQKMRCEVTDVDRSTHNIVVSRRIILEREGEAERANALARLSEGEVLKGTVVRVNDFGAFIDLGGMDGLIPASKIHTHVKAKTLDEPLKEGQSVQVQVVRVDREKGRVSLDLKMFASDSWNKVLESYTVGEEVTGWVSRASPTEITLSIEEGVEGVIPEMYIHILGGQARPGAILKAEVAAIDPNGRKIILKPRSAQGNY